MQTFYDSRMEILAVIPARAGSAGIPKKNIKLFAGKPLIAYSIEAARASLSVGRIIVSTDSEEIAAIAKDYGAEVPYLRPAELSTASSRVVDAVMHLLEYLKQNEDYRPSHVLLLQPTSPLRTRDDIEKAVALLKSSDADEVVSVTRTENVLMTKDKEGVLTVQDQQLLNSPNRQELPAYYKFDGSMIYLIKTDVLEKERSFFAGKVVGYEIPRWRGVDLDEPQDFVVGELVFKHKDDIERQLRDFS